MICRRRKVLSIKKRDHISDRGVSNYYSLTGRNYTNTQEPNSASDFFILPHTGMKVCLVFRPMKHRDTTNSINFCDRTNPNDRLLHGASSPKRKDVLNLASFVTS